MGGDPTQMRQVVMNLVTNASDAIGGTGHHRIRVVVVRLGRRRPRRAGAADRAGERGDYVVLEVSDTGCGMTPEMQARIFDPFFTTKFTGRGLGLAAVHGIVRGHRGGVRVESAPQLGSTFSVALPAIAQPAEPLSALAPSTDAWRGSASCWSPTTRSSSATSPTTMLQQMGFEVVAVAERARGGRGVRRQPGPVRPGAARPDDARS